MAASLAKADRAEQVDAIFLLVGMLRLTAALIYRAGGASPLAKGIAAFCSTQTVLSAAAAMAAALGLSKLLLPMALLGCHKTQESLWLPSTRRHPG